MHKVNVAQYDNGHTIQVNLENSGTLTATLEDYMGNMNSFEGL